MQEAEVDVSRDMLREPWLEFRGARDLALSVDGGEAVERADQDDEVCCGQEQAGPEWFGHGRLERRSGAVEGAIAVECTVKGRVCGVVHGGYESRLIGEGAWCSLCDAQYTLQ